MAKKSNKIPNFNFRETSNGRISLFLSYNKLRMQIPTGIVVNMAHWDRKRQRLNSSIRGKQNYTKINRELSKWREVAEQAYIDTGYGAATYEAYKNEIRYEMGLATRPNEYPTELLPFISKIVADLKDDPSKNKGTWGKFEALAVHLKQYEKDTRTELDFDSIDWNFKTKFEKWLYAAPRSFSSNNASKLFAVLRQLLRDGYRRRLHTNKVFDEKGFSISRVKTRSKVRFDLDEIKAIEQYDFSQSPRLKRVRDIFLFACWTGLRISDWWKISKTNRRKLENEYVLETVTQKTKTRVYIPLLPPIESVLDRYNWQLPKISDQKFNAYIKEVIKQVLPDARFTRIYSEGGQQKQEERYKWEFVSSHAGRRTFATNAYLISKSAQDVMQVTGHATEKQFFEYIDLRPERQAVRLTKSLTNHFST